MWHIEDCSPPTDWPAAGAVTFDKYSTRYRPGLDLVLQDIDLDVKAGKKVRNCRTTCLCSALLIIILFLLLQQGCQSNMIVQFVICSVCEQDNSRLH